MALGNGRAPDPPPPPRFAPLVQRFMDDCDQCLNRLGEDMKSKVLRFVVRLRECTRTHCDTNGPAIQKNISRICQDQVRLQEVRRGIEGLMEENDPFRFIEVRRRSLN